MPAVASGSLSPSPAEPRAGEPNVGLPVRKSDFGPRKRLLQSEDFVALLKNGQRRSAAGFTFLFRRRERGDARLGILVSRKHARLATDRNRIKRCIREAFRLEHHNLGSIDVLVRPPYGFRVRAGLVARLRVALSGLSR